MIKPSGPKDAKIAIVGEAPSAEDDRIGSLFSDNNGKLLDRLLGLGGIQREDCYITAVTLVRPVKNNFGELYYDKGKKQPREALLESYKRLYKELEEVKPNIIILLGDEALKALTGQTLVSKRRGSVTLTMTTSGTSFKVMPTIAPDKVMKNWDYFPLVICDLKRAKEESAFPEVRKIPRTYQVIESLEELSKMVDSYIKSEYIAFDIETNNNQISCIGFSNNASHAFTIPICLYDKNFWQVEEEMIVWKEIERLLTCPAKKIAQNANFDIFFIKKLLKIKVENFWLDTMNAWHCVYPELPKGLDTITSILTDQPYYKDTITTEFYKYNCLDAMVTLECALKIEQEMKEFGVRDFYHHHVHVLVDPLIDMQMRGVLIDKEKRAQAAESMKKDILEKQQLLNEIVGYDLNVNSPKQMCNFLYKDLGLPPQYNKKSGGLTADETTLQKLAKKFPNKIFELVLEIRGLIKLVSTYLEASIDNDDRFRCSYLLTGTESGRLASRKSIYGTGGNLQNVPRGIAREVFIPDEGKMFISADLSQAEARVVAYLADDQKLIDALEAGGDVHKRVASIMFNTSYENVTTEQRELGKRIVHASNYGMGPRKFAELTGMSQRDAIDKMNLFHNTFPKIKMWHMSIEQKLGKTRLLETPMGRKRIFFGRWSDSLIRDAYSYIPQSTVADLTLRGMYQVYCNLPEDWDLVFNIHDEVVIQAPIMEGNELEEALHSMAKWMSVPIEVNGKLLKIPVGVQYGMNWNEVH